MRIFGALRRPCPTTIGPTPTVTTANAKLSTVGGIEYRTGLSGTSKPSMAAKCMSQMAPPPIAKEAITSQRLRLPRLRASRARRVDSSPKKEPTDAEGSASRKSA